VRLFRRYRPDAVLLYGQFAGFYGALASRLTGVPAVYEAHFPSFVTDGGVATRVRNHAVEWATCRLSCVTTTVSRADLQEYLRRGLQYPSRIHLVANGVNVASADPAYVDLLRRQLLGSGDFLVLGPGRLYDQKGFDVLLAAIPRVVEQCPPARLAIVGEGPSRNALESFVDVHRLTHAVRFYDFQRNLGAWMEAADLVVVPSRYEPGGLVAREAMAVGRAVIASDVQGLSEAIEHGRTGYLVHPDDPGALADAIVGLLRDGELRETLGRRARDAAAARFRREAMWEGYEGVLAALGVVPPPFD